MSCVDERIVYSVTEETIRQFASDNWGVDDLTQDEIDRIGEELNMQDSDFIGAAIHRAIRRVR